MASEKEKEGVASVFDRRAEEYDQWFENSLLFDTELLALRELETGFGHPRLEIGVGPGRFARELLIDYGLDPAFSPLVMAGRRGVQPVQGPAEFLPFASGSLAAVFILFTLCFLADPFKALEECYRVLRPRGHLILGIIPSTGSWGQYLQAKKREGHPFYRYAHFYESSYVQETLARFSFALVESRATLFQPPGQLTGMESSGPGIRREAGFQVMVGEKK